MMPITNPKVASVEPRWAPFSGFSLLFDNPGDSVSLLGEGLLKADCSLERNEDLELYRRFVRFLDEVGTHKLRDNYSFCPLHPYSYHVTVWDGLNDGNLEQVPAGDQPRLRDFLNHLPDALITDRDFTAQVMQSALVTRANWSIRLQFKTLAKWSNQSLVAVLMPAEGDSELEFERIVQERAALSAQFRDRFGIAMRRSYHPHVTLGYFANEQQAELCSPHVDGWTERLQKFVGRLTITFRSISLYGFTDMVTFFKIGPRD
jgi:2'-5' RNA ligase